MSEGKGVKKLVMVIGLAFCLVGNAGGQPGTSPNDGAAPGEAPISGIEILIGVGGLLGAKKIFDSRKKNQPNP